MRLILVLMLALVMAGCASSGRQIDPSMIDQIEHQQTTRSDLVSMFGQPTSETVNSDGSAILNWTYAYVGYAGIGTKVQGLTVVINESGTVESYSKSDSTPGAVRLGQ